MIPEFAGRLMFGLELALSLLILLLLINPPDPPDYN